MARLPRFNLPGVAQHIIQRGNNRQACFASERDFSAYANWLEEYSKKFDVAIHAWVFMTNHVHLLATPKKGNGVSLMMQSLGRRYVQYFNYQYRRSGTLWEGRYKSCLVQSEEYLLECYRYIELNPVRANMVALPADYPWSSFQFNALGKKVSFCSPHPEYLRLGRIEDERQEAYKCLFRGHVDQTLINAIQTTTNQGMVLGNDRFKREIEALTGRRTSVAKAGRPIIKKTA